MEEWKEYKLGEVAIPVRDRIDTSVLDASSYISTENMLPDKAGVTLSSGIPSGKAIQFKDGDVLISNIRPYFKKIWRADKVGGCSADVICLRAAKIIDSLFLYYLMSQDLFFDYVMQGAKGTKMPRGDRNQMMQWPVLLPSKSEQQKIASILSALDDKIEVNRRINDNLEQQAQALFKSWFVDFEPFKDDEFVESELGMIPKGWRVVELADVCTIKYGKGLGKNDLTQKGFPVFGGNGIIGFYTQYLYNLPQILVSCRGAASGKIIESLPQSYVTSNSLVLELKDRFYYNYLKFFLLSKPLYDYATGSAQPQITIDNIKGVKVLLPHQEVIQKMDPILKVIGNTQRNNEFKSRRLAELRDTLLPKLMSGELRVQDTDLINEMLEKGIR